MTIQEIVADILKKKEAVGGVDSVYLVACGGSFAGFYPAKYLLDHASRTLRCAMFTANEFAVPCAVRPKRARRCGRPGNAARPPWRFMCRRAK